MTEHLITRAPTRPRAGRSWPAAALALAAVGWGANQFAPLLPLYRTTLGLSSATAQASFVLYALGLIPGLLAGGTLSDRYGRRRVVLSALVGSLLASAMLIAGGTGLGWLLAGRLVAGVAGGAAYSAGTVWVKELSVSTGADNPGPRRATVAMTAGFAGGPLVAGTLAQWAPWPTVLPYLPHLALAAVATGWVVRAPETRPNGSGAAADRPRVGRRFRMVVIPLAPWVFVAGSVGVAYLSGLAERRMGGHTLVFGAGVAALTALAGIAVQPLARRVDRSGSFRLLGVALGLVAGGLLVAAAAAATAGPGLVVAAALVLGAGYGACQVAGLLEVQRLAPPEHLARLTALYQALSYLGFAAPYLLAAAQRWVSASTALLVAAGAAVVTLLWLAASASQPTPGDVR